MRTIRAVLAWTAVLMLAGCSWPPGSSVETLAKVDGWRGGYEAAEPFAVLELAYDDTTARTLWRENVPDGLPDRDGDPLEQGVYGDLADVDLDRQVVGLVSTGQSGSCPGWVDGVQRRDGTVDVTLAEDLLGGDGCNDDYNAYRVVIAIDRADVPPRDALTGDPGRVDGREVLEVAVGEYPLAG